MKKILFTLSVMGLAMMSCQDADQTTQFPEGAMIDYVFGATSGDGTDTRINIDAGTGSIRWDALDYAGGVIMGESDVYELEGKTVTGTDAYTTVLRGQLPASNEEVTFYSIYPYGTDVVMPMPQSTKLHVNFPYHNTFAYPMDGNIDDVYGKMLPFVSYPLTLTPHDPTSKTLNFFPLPSMFMVNIAPFSIWTGDIETDQVVASMTADGEVFHSSLYLDMAKFVQNENSGSVEPTYVWSLNGGTSSNSISTTLDFGRVLTGSNTLPANDYFTIPIFTSPTLGEPVNTITVTVEFKLAGETVYVMSKTVDVLETYSSWNSGVFNRVSFVTSGDLANKMEPTVAQ